MGKTLIKTVSIPKDMQKFLDDNPDLSLSKICQAKIIEIMQNRRIIFAQVERLIRANKMLQEKLFEAQDMIALLQKKLNPKEKLDDGNNKKLD